MGAIKPIEHYALKKGCCVHTDNNDVDLSGLVPKEWLMNYSELSLEQVRASTQENATSQGGCTDGNYLYRALVTDNADLTTLQKIDINTGEVLLEVKETSYTHANDMTYCSKDGYIYIAHGSENNATISKVNRHTLKEVEKFTIGSGIWSIAYNEVDDIWVCGISGGYYFTVFDSNWELLYRLRPENSPYGYVKQSITCDENYIYAGYYRSNKKGCLVYVFTWNGMFAHNFIINTDNELEFLDRIGSTFYIGFYDGRDTNELKWNSISKANFDMYPEATANNMRPTDVEGGINALQRLPDGTEVCVWRGQATSGTLKCHPKITRNAFRYYKIVGTGANQFTSNWFKGGRCKVTEINPDDTLQTYNLDFKECLLEYDLETNSFTIVSNITHKLFVYADGKIEHSKGDNVTDNGLNIIYISQIWGIV